MSVGPRSPCQDTLQHFKLKATLKSLVCRSSVPMPRHISIFIMFCCITIAGQLVLCPCVKTHCNILNWMLLCNHWSVGPRSPCQDTLHYFELNAALQWLVCRSPVPMSRHIATFWIFCYIALQLLVCRSPVSKTRHIATFWIKAALQSLVCSSPVPMPRHIATFGIECCIKTTGL
jgi:hypothetical protein